MKNGGKFLKLAVGVLLLFVVAEGIIGSQIREITDEMAKTHLHEARSEWIGELEQAGIYLFHRSFSWAVLAAAVCAWWLTLKHREGGAGWVERFAVGIVFSQMILGMVMARVHIYAGVQLLHVGLAAVLLVLCCLWWLGLSRDVSRS